jgi:hypothetical protein
VAEQPDAGSIWEDGLGRRDVDARVLSRDEVARGGLAEPHRLVGQRWVGEHQHRRPLGHRPRCDQPRIATGVPGRARRARRTMSALRMRMQP